MITPQRFNIQKKSYTQLCVQEALQKVVKTQIFTNIKLTFLHLMKFQHFEQNCKTVLQSLVVLTEQKINNNYILTPFSCWNFYDQNCSLILHYLYFEVKVNIIEDQILYGKIIQDWKWSFTLNLFINVSTEMHYTTCIHFTVYLIHEQNHTYRTIKCTMQCMYII